MGLFFDNKQHLSEMKKIYLLEKRVDRLENVVEGELLRESDLSPEEIKREVFSELEGLMDQQETEESREEGLSKEEIVREVLSKIQDQSISETLSKKEWEEKIQEYLEEKKEKPSGELEERIQKLESLLQQEGEKEKEKGEMPSDFAARLEALEEAISSLGAPPSPEGEVTSEVPVEGPPSSEEEEDAPRGILGSKPLKLSRKKTEKIPSTPPPASKGEGPSGEKVSETPRVNIEEIQNKIKREVEELLSSNKEEKPSPEAQRPLIEGIVEELLETQYLPQIRDLLERQVRKIKKVEKKIARLTIMMTSFDFEDEEDDLMEALLPSRTSRPSRSTRSNRRNGRRKSNFSPPPQEEKREPLSPEKNAALESLFNMNMDIQK